MVTAVVTAIKAAGGVGLVSSRHIWPVVKEYRAEVAVAEAAVAADWEMGEAETAVEGAAVRMAVRILNHPAEVEAFQGSKAREAARSLVR